MVKKTSVLDLYSNKTFKHYKWKKWLEKLSSDEKKWVLYIVTKLKKKIEKLNIKVSIVPLAIYNGIYFIDYAYDYTAVKFPKEYRNEEPIVIFVIELDENEHIAHLKLMDWGIKRKLKRELIALLKKELGDRWIYKKGHEFNSKIMFIFK